MSETEAEVFAKLVEVFLEKTGAQEFQARYYILKSRGSIAEAVDRYWQEVDRKAEFERLVSGGRPPSKSTRSTLACEPEAARTQRSGEEAAPEAQRGERSEEPEPARGSSEAADAYALMTKGSPE